MSGTIWNDIYQTLKKKWWGKLFIVMCLFCVLAFTIWNSLPDSIKEKLLNHNTRQNATSSTIKNQTKKSNLSSELPGQVKHSNSVVKQSQTIIYKADSLQNKLLNNGEPCKRRSDCYSNYCMPGPSPKPIARNPAGGGTWYCTAADMNCALPGTDGAKYGETINVAGSTLRCMNPNIDGYWGQFMR